MIWRILINYLQMAFFSWETHFLLHSVVPIGPDDKHQPHSTYKPMYMQIGSQMGEDKDLVKNRESVGSATSRCRWCCRWPKGQSRHGDPESPVELWSRTIRGHQSQNPIRRGTAPFQPNATQSATRLDWTMAYWLTVGPKMLVTARKHEHEGQKVHGKRNWSKFQLFYYKDSCLSKVDSQESY